METRRDVRLLPRLLLSLLLLQARSGAAQAPSLGEIVTKMAAQVDDISRKLDVLPQMLARLEALEGCENTPEPAEGSACESDADCVTPAVGLTCSGGSCALRACRSVQDPELSDTQWRLVGGSSCSDGYVQILSQNVTAFFVCDSDWTEPAAAVACRSLGFRGGATRAMSAEIDTTSTWGYEHFACSGSERRLHDCQRDEYRSVCAVSELAAVTCHN